MPTRSKRPGESVSHGRGSEQSLLDRVRNGKDSAIESLFVRYAPWVRRRVRGRLPHWARNGITTSDLAQDVLRHTFARLAWFESKHMSALKSYLRRAVENRVQDELRRATRRLDKSHFIASQESRRLSENASPQHQQLLNKELWKRYRNGLKGLKDRDRRLIVGRAELGYSYRQLAAIERMPSADAARKALKRAVIRLSKVMPKA